MADAAAMAAGAAVEAAVTAAAAASPLTTNRADPRRSHRSRFHARVRADALARQRAARGEELDAARRNMAARVLDEQGGGGEEAIEVDAAAAAAAPSSPAVEDDDRRGGNATASPRAPPPPPRPFWARQLMRHEWMVDVPEDLGTNWLVLPRPEGIRCLLVSGRGRTVARGRNGAVLHEFASLLPGGGGGGGAGVRREANAAAANSAPSSSSEGSCVLDAIFQPDPNPNPDSASLQGTFFALDVLSWGQRDLRGCDAAFRLSFWLPAKLSEAGCFCSSSGSNSALLPPGVARVVPLRAVEAIPEGILAAVAGGGGGGSENGTGNGNEFKFPSFTRDGVLFLHVESAYSCDEASPLALVWKDGSCSRYVVDTDAGGKALERQSVLLRVAEVEQGGGGEEGGRRRCLAAATGDEPPVPLAPVPLPVPVPSAPSSSSSSPNNQSLSPFKPGRLLRFAVGPGGFSFAGNEDGGGSSNNADGAAPPSVSADLEFLAPLPASSNRFRGAGGGADTLSKLLFQAAARHGELPALGGLLEVSAAAAKKKKKERTLPGVEEEQEEEMNLG